jgi:hypothetical protein
MVVRFRSAMVSRFYVRPTSKRWSRALSVTCGVALNEHEKTCFDNKGDIHMNSINYEINNSNLDLDLLTISP